MKKHHGLMHGTSVAEPHPADEAAYKPLARGALQKAAEKYRGGEMSDEEFRGHIHKAHSRLQDSMPTMSAMPMQPMMKASKQKNHARKGKKADV